MLTKSTLTEIAELKRYNHRTAALAVAARALGLVRVAEQLDDIDKEHASKGMSAEMYNRRSSLAAQVYNAAKATMNDADLALFCRCL